MTTYAIRRNLKVLSFSLLNGLEIEYVFNGEVKYLRLARLLTCELLKQREDIIQYWLEDNDEITLEWTWENEHGREHKSIVEWDWYCVNVGLCQWQALDIVTRHEANELLKIAVKKLQNPKL